MLDLPALFPPIRGAKDNKSGGSRGGPREAPDTLLVNSTARLIDVVSEGPIGGWADPEHPGRCIFFDGVPLENPDGSLNFAGVRYTLRTGGPDQAPVPGFSEAEAEVAVAQVVEQQQPVARTITNEAIDSVRVKVGLAQLTTLDIETGNLNGGVVEYAIETQIGSAGWQRVVSGRFEGKTTSGYQRAHRVPLPDARPVSVRVVRITDDATTSSVSDEISFVSYTEIVEARLTYPDTAYVALEFPADAFSGRIPERSYDLVGVAIQVPTNYSQASRTYDESSMWNGTLKTVFPDAEAGCNPMWWLFTMLGNDRWGLGDRVPAALRDKWTAYQIAKYCDVMVDDGRGGQERRYSISGVFTVREQAYEVVRRVAAIFRSMVYWSRGAIVLAQDAPRDPVKLVTNANVEGGSFVYASSALAARRTAANMSFRDPTDRYAIKALISYDDPEAVERYGRRVADVVESEVASYGQALRAARWLIYTETQETETVSYTAGMDHAAIRPGDRIIVSDRYRVGIRAGGRVVSVAGAVVTLDAPFTFQAGVTYTLRLATASGGWIARQVAASVVGTRSVVTLTAVASGVEPGAVYAISSTTLSARQFTVIQNRRQGVRYAITAVEHNPNKFQAVEQGIVIDDDPPFILPVNRKPPAPVGLNHVIWTKATGARPEAWATLSCSPESGGVPISQWIARIRLATPVGDQVLTNQVVFSGSPVLIGGAPVTIGGNVQNQVRAQTEWRRLPGSAQPSVDVQLWAGAASNYVFQFRSVSATGLVSDWSEERAFNTPEATRPPPPTNLRLEPGVRSIQLYFSMPDIDNLRDIEVWGGTSPDPADDVRLGTTLGSTWLLEGIAIASVWYFRVRARANQARNATSVFSERISGSPRRMTAEELEEEILDRIDAAEEEAQQAAQDAIDALNQSAVAAAKVDALSQDTLDQLETIVDALAGINTGDIQEIRGIAIAGSRQGWSADPTFQEWTGADLTRWTTSGVVEFGSRVAGHRGQALRITIPSGSGVMTLRASSATAGQLTAADPEAEYVLVSVRFVGISGSLGGGRLRAEWRRASDGVWVRGHAFGVNNSFGNLITDWGFVIDPDRMQSAERVWRRPGPAADYDAVQIYFIGKMASPADAVTFNLEVLDIREASETDVISYNVPGSIAAAITAYDTTITGPGGALAAQYQQITAEYGAAVAGVTDAVVAVASAQSAQAGRLSVLEAGIGGANLVRNPAFRGDGQALAAGVVPLTWTTWSNGLSVVERNLAASETPLRTTPTRFVARAAAGTNSGQAVGSYPVARNGRLRAEVDAAVFGGAQSRTLRVLVQWIGPDDAILSNTTRDLTVTGTAWVRRTFPDFIVPEGAAQANVFIQPLAATGVILFFTNVDVREVDAVTLARITQAETALSDQQGAIATISTELDATKGDAEAALSQVATVVARDDLLATTWVLRQRAGQAQGFLEAVAFDNPDGPALSTFKISYDFIDLDGRVSARDIVVHDPANLVPGNAFRLADDFNVETGWSLVPSAVDAMKNANAFLYTNSGGTGASGVVACRRFPVSGDEPYFFEISTRGNTSGQHSLQLFVQWFDRAGQVTQESVINEVVTLTGIRTFTRTLSAPANAVEARVFWRTLRESTTRSFQVGHVLVRKREFAATLIRPGGIFTPELAANAVTAEKADLVSLAAVEAWVGSLTIGEDAVTVPLFVERTTDVDGPNGNQAFANIVSFNVTLNIPGTILVNATVGLTGFGATIFNNIAAEWRIVIDGTVAWQSTTVTGPMHVSLTAGKFCAAGARNVSIQFRKGTVNAEIPWPRAYRCAATCLVAKR
jgi:predicted phage tail protein